MAKEKAYFFVNQETGKKFQVLEWDEETNRMRLKGDHNPFEETYSKEEFAAQGYALVVEEVETEDAG